MDLSAGRGNVVEEIRKKNLLGKKKGRRGTNRSATCSGVHTTNQSRNYLTAMCNLLYMVVIRQMSNGNNSIMSPT
jgi:hypothetical protein